jgi:hypothetical protein
MLAFADQQHGIRVRRNRAEKDVEAEDGFVVERVALLRPVEPQHGDSALLFGLQRGGKAGAQRIDRIHQGLLLDRRSRDGGVRPMTWRLLSVPAETVNIVVLDNKPARPALRYSTS